MKRVLIVSKNLIGDGLCAGVAIREWFRLHDPFHTGKSSEYDEVDLLTNQDHVTKIYSGLGVEWSHIFTSDEAIQKVNVGMPYNKIYTLGAGEAGKYAEDNKCHIIEGFCKLLEIEPPKVDIVKAPMGTFKAWKPFYDPWVTLLEQRQGVLPEEGLILFSPFSASCSSRKGGLPNKMLYPSHWVTILESIRKLGPIRMLGAPDDLPDPSWRLSEEEIMTGVPLDWLAVTMQKAKLVITIDNGMGHLAASQDAKHILFYPICLDLNFILSWGANNTVPIQLDPTSIEIRQLMWAFNRAIRQLEVK